MAPSRSPIRAHQSHTSRFSDKPTNNLHRRSKERSLSRERHNKQTITHSHRRHESRRSASPDRSAGSPPRYRIRRATPDLKTQISDGPSRKIFITNLSRNIENKHLHEIFATFGELVSADVSKYDNFMVSNSFGHVIYKDIKSAQNAMKHMQGGQIDGLLVNLEFVPYNRQSSVDRRHRSSS